MNLRRTDARLLLSLEADPYYPVKPTKNLYGKTLVLLVQLLYDLVLFTGSLSNKE